jgi:hypothetical protein
MQKFLVCIVALLTLNSAQAGIMDSIAAQYEKLQKKVDAKYQSIYNTDGSSICTINPGTADSDVLNQTDCTNVSVDASGNPLMKTTTSVTVFRNGSLTTMTKTELLTGPKKVAVND